MNNEKIEEVVAMTDDCVRIYTPHLEYLRKTIGWFTNAKKTLHDISPYLDYSDFDEAINMHSFNSLLTISLLDLFVICKKLLTAENDWEKAFFLKHGYLTIYETIDTFNEHNQNIIKLIDTPKYNSLKGMHLSVTANLKQFKKVYSYQENIKNIRHTIAGHIDKDFINYYDTLLKIKGDDESEAILAFISILKQIETLSFEMEKISKDYVTEQLEKEGMGTTIEEISTNFDKKLESFRQFVEEKMLELKEQLPPT
ncbi:MAG TPA: hypothetical protein PK289_11815 [Bacteroidia bacterium]|nr:hypothetical protein [Bacteroidia bacterium]